MNLYAIKDVKIGFLTPFVQQNQEVAIRSFKAAINDVRSSIYSYPDDMELWNLGEFDEETGKINITPKHPLYVIGGRSVKDERN